MRCRLLPEQLRVHVEQANKGASRARDCRVGRPRRVLVDWPLDGAASSSSTCRSGTSGTWPRWPRTTWSTTARFRGRKTDSVSGYGRLYNLIWFNNGYHQEHHWRPQVHWTEVPALRAQLPPETSRRVVRAAHWFNFFPPPRSLSRESPDAADPPAPLKWHVGDDPARL